MLQWGKKTKVVDRRIIFLFVWNCTEELIRGVSVITHTLDLDLDLEGGGRKEEGIG